MPQARVNGVRLYHHVQGEGEALVMIPGMGAGHTSWFRQLPAFKKHFKVVTFDPRSIGRSERPKQPYGFKALADDVVALMDHLGINRGHILGQSLGGLVGQEIAIDYPDRVAELVLVSSTPASADNNPTNPALMEALGLANGTAEIDFHGLDTRKTMNALIGMSFNKPHYRIAMQTLSVFFVKLETFDGLSDQVRAIAGYNTLDRLHLIKAPTLVIAGDEDHVVLPSGSEMLAARIPNARLVIFKGGSHGFNVEMTARFNREVLEFLRAA